MTSSSSTSSQVNSQPVLDQAGSNKPILNQAGSNQAGSNKPVLPPSVPLPSVFSPSVLPQADLPQSSLPQSISHPPLARQSVARVAQPRPPQAVNPWQWLWLFLWIILLTGSGILGTWAMIWLTRIPPLPNCEEISRISSSRDRLYCAKFHARSGSSTDLAKAIQLTAGWPKTHNNYEEAQEVLKGASQKLLVLANKQVQTGALEDAIDLASQIPQGTPLRKSAQAVIYEWRQEWATGETLETTLATAIQTRTWDTAASTLQKLKTLESNYWLQDRYLHWLTHLQREKASWENLETARELATKGNPKDLDAAITLARKVDLGGRTWVEAEQDIHRWSQDLLQSGLQQWRNGDLEGAIAVAQKVPPQVAEDPESQALLQFAHAQKLANQAVPQASTYTSTYAHLFYLMEAIRAVEQIPNQSPFHSQAQALKQDWQAQLEDATQLQLAQAIAQFGQGVTYEVAIAQASTVEPGRPRRIQAQTLIAQWRSDIQRIADRPILRRADYLAKSGTIPALQAAMAEASKIERGRALRIEAQTRIADWRGEIQVIEDRPLLDEAVALAKQNKLPEAIKAAQKIQPGRALHSRAQTLIADWTRTIQIAEDQPILDEAKDLAYAGSLTAAIAVASQIGPGRALYGEAQRAIKLWEAERAYIWSISNPPAEGTSSDDTSTEDTEFSEPEFSEPEFSEPEVQ